MDLRTEHLRRLAVKAESSAGSYWKVEDGVWLVSSGDGSYAPIPVTAIDDAQAFTSYASPARVIALVNRVEFLESLRQARDEADAARRASGITVARKDISVDEERYNIGPSLMATSFTASLDGRLSTGERVTLSRTGDTFSEALSELGKAIAAEGWTLR